MEEKANGIDSPLDVIQDRLGDVVGVALDKSHWITKGQGTHHIVAVVYAYFVHQNWLSDILTDSNEELAGKLLDPGGIVRKCSRSVSLSVAHALL